MSRPIGLSSFAANFEPKVASPLDSRTVVSYLTDLSASSTWNTGDGNAYVYVGMPVSVINDGSNNGIYWLKSSDYTSVSNWEKIGSTEGLVSISGDLYTLVSDISGYLQTEITDNRTEVITVSGNLYTLIANTSGYLQDQITSIGSISGDWARLSGENVFTGTLNTFNNTVEVFDDLTVHGTFTVAGSAFTVDTEHVRTSDNKITINYGETSPTGVTSITAGIEVDRGPDNEPYYFIFDERNNDYFRIGTASSLQAVATREDSPEDRGLAYWDSSGEIFLTDSSTTIDTVTGAFLDISNNRSEVIAVSGNLYTLILNTSGYFQSEMVAVSGNLYTLIANTSGYLQSELVSVSGTLYTNLANTSGALQSQLTFLESISADWARKSLDNTFIGVNNFNNNVNIYDDLFVTGTLVVSGAIDISPSQTLLSSVTDTYIVNTSGEFTPETNLVWSTNAWTNIFTTSPTKFNQTNQATSNDMRSGTPPYQVTAIDNVKQSSAYLSFNNLTSCGAQTWQAPSYPTGNFLNCWIELILESPLIFTYYTIGCTTNLFPSAWRLQTSINGTDWTTIDTRTNMSIGCGSTSTNLIISNPVSSLLYRIIIDSSGWGALGTISFFAGGFATDSNTATTNELIPNGSIKNISPSTLVLKDTTTGAEILGAGLVNVAYCQNGNWSSLIDLVAFKALSNITSCSSFKLKIQPVGAQTVGYVSIATPSSSISLKSDGTITNNVNNVPIFSVDGNGAVVASGTIIADNCYGRSVQISNTNSPYSLDTNYTTVRINASGGPVVVNLPTAVGVEGRRYTFSAITQPTSTITLSGSLGQTIDGSSTYTGLRNQWDNISIESNNANWFAVSDVNSYSLVGSISGYLQSELIGVSGNLYTLIANTSAANHSELVGVSGYLQDQLNNLDLNYATDASLTSVSGNLYTLITDTSGYLQSEMVAVSGNLYTLITDTSGYLQTEITNNRTEVIEVSGNLYTLIANTSAANHSELLGVSGNLYTTIANVSGYLQDQLNNLDLNYATDASLTSVSGNLYTLIVNTSGYLQSEMVGVSGNLYTLITDTSGYLQTEIVALSANDTTLSASISGLSNHFVNAEITGISGTWTQVSCVPIAATNKVTWELVAIDEDDVTHRYASTVSAIHNGSTGVSWAEYAVLYTGTQTTLQVRVTNDGTTMCLEVSE